jgi:hypothetical protein
MTKYWDGVLIGALCSGFIWRWIFFVVDTMFGGVKREERDGKIG